VKLANVRLRVLAAFVGVSILRVLAGMLAAVFLPVASSPA
jgi:hypothetical protein